MKLLIHKPFAVFGVIVLCHLIVSCQSEEDAFETSGDKTAAINGEDDRKDVYEYMRKSGKTPLEMRIEKLARDATVAFIPKGNLKNNDDNTFSPNAETLHQRFINEQKKTHGLCDGERYGDNPTAAKCSGTLIGENLVLTAGHCFGTLECEDFYFVFDYYYESKGTLAEIDAGDVYTCKRVVVNGYMGALPNSSTEKYYKGSVDYAVVEIEPLDKEKASSASREPAEVLAGRPELRQGDQLITIGFPTGIPAKIDDSGQVIKASDRFSFDAKTDTFGGNSGSGVYNSSGELIGIFVRGGGEYYPVNDCYKAVVWEEEGRTLDDEFYELYNSDVEYAHVAMNHLEKKLAEEERDRTDFCGNGYCGKNENSESCIEDCPKFKERTETNFILNDTHDTWRSTVSFTEEGRVDRAIVQMDISCFDRDKLSVSLVCPENENVVELNGSVRYSDSEITIYETTGCSGQSINGDWELSFSFDWDDTLMPPTEWKLGLYYR